MKIENVRDVRALVAANDGRICIGKLVLEVSGGDVDVKLDGDLIAYVPAAEADSNPLANCLAVMSGIAEGRAAHSELAAAKTEAEDARRAELAVREELKALAATTAEVVAKATADASAAELRGRLAAYEDLVGRAVSIAPRA